MLHHQSEEVSDQSVTRLAMALYEADQEAARKQQALEQAAAEIGVPPHYLELARQQLAQAQATHQQQATATRRRPSPAFGLAVAFVTALVMMCGLWVATSPAPIAPPALRATESTPAIHSPVPAGSSEPVPATPEQPNTPTGEGNSEIRVAR